MAGDITTIAGGSPLATGTTLAPEGTLSPRLLNVGDLNLNSLNDTVGEWFIAGSNRLTLQAELLTGTWGTAQVRVECSVSGNTWDLIEKFTAVGTLRSLDVGGYTMARARVAVVGGGTGTAIFSPYSFAQNYLESTTRFLTWSPTYTGSGSLTYASVTTNYARYFKLDDVIWYSLGATGTTGGVVSTRIIFTTPETISTDTKDRGMGAGYVYDAAYRTAHCEIESSTTLGIRKYNNTNYGLGASRTIQVSGFYQAV